jgi:two-component system, NarL family, nitrate/nitrite response regulator NarL
MLRRVGSRCLIVDDNSFFLEVAAPSLSGDELDVVGTATTSAEALSRVAELRPDVVLVDINLGDESGFELVSTLSERFPELASGLVLISTRARRDFGGLVEASPAAGFIRKTQLSARAVRELVASPGRSDPGET